MGEVNFAQYSSTLRRFLVILAFHPVGETRNDEKACVYWSKLHFSLPYPRIGVDIMVLLSGPVALGRDLRTIIDALYPLQLEIDRILEAFPVDEEDYLRGEYAWYREAQKDGIRI